MGVRILEDRQSGEAVFYCSTTDWAFGPLMEDVETAEKFLEWLGSDPRMMHDHALESKWVDYKREKNE